MITRKFRAQRLEKFSHETNERDSPASTSPESETLATTAAPEFLPMVVPTVVSTMSDRSERLIERRDCEIGEFCQQMLSNGERVEVPTSWRGAAVARAATERAKAVLTSMLNESWNE